MERLISSRINPVSAYNRRYQSTFLHTSTLQLRNCYCAIRVGFIKKPVSFKVVAASVQPAGDSKVGQFDNALPSKEILELWRNADAVCFDVDSTVCIDEGIDELAEFCGAGKAVAEWTARAMGGSVPFEDALAARLSLFNPSLSQVQNFLVQRPPRLSSGIEELIGKLKANQIQVYLISGGFRQMINPVASILGIPRENIFANQLLFGNSGEFLGFDKNEPTSRSGGKATAVQQIRKARQYKSLVMVGDGATDLEARRPGGADLFICYAGVQLREPVAAKADWAVDCPREVFVGRYDISKSPPLSLADHVVIAIGFVHGNHFVQVLLKDRLPIPPTVPGWRRYARVEAHAWEASYVDRMKLFKH